MLKNKAKLALYKAVHIAQTRFPGLFIPENRAAMRQTHALQLPQVSAIDAFWIDSLRAKGVCIFPLSQLELLLSKPLLQTVSQVLPYLRNANPSVSTSRVPMTLKANFPELYLWGMNKRLLDSIENYIGLPILFNGADIRRDNPHPKCRGFRQWHRDVEDDRMVKIIIYLNNVAPTGGPFEYIPRPLSAQLAQHLNYGSGFVSDKTVNNIIPRNQWKNCPGPMGTVVVMDPTRIFHRIKPPVIQSRYSITYSYTSRSPKILLSEFKPQQTCPKLMPHLTDQQKDCLR